MSDVSIPFHFVAVSFIFQTKQKLGMIFTFSYFIGGQYSLCSTFPVTYSHFATKMFWLLNARLYSSLASPSIYLISLIRLPLESSILFSTTSFNMVMKYWPLIGLLSIFQYPYEDQLQRFPTHLRVAVIFFRISTTDIIQVGTLSFICFLPVIFNSNVQIRIVLIYPSKIKDLSSRKC